MRTMSGQIVWLALLSAVILAGGRKIKPVGKPSIFKPSKDFDLLSCIACIVANAPRCLPLCVPVPGSKCISCLLGSAAQCIPVCGFSDFGNFESEDFGLTNGPPQIKELCGTPQPTCPPSPGLRIMNEPSVGAHLNTPEECESWCKHSDISPLTCGAWSFHYRLKMCFLFDPVTPPTCYVTKWERNWVSGKSCIYMNIHEDGYAQLPGSTNPCYTIGVDYPKDKDLVTFYPVFTAEDCACKCQPLGTSVGWSWGNQFADQEHIHHCWCKTHTNTTATNNLARTSGIPNVLCTCP